MIERFRRLASGFGLTLLLLASSALPAAAADKIPAPARPDVRVLIDISGSMKQSDPHNLRQSALRMLVQLYPRGARGGVWTFAEKARPLVAEQTVTEQWRNAARRKAAGIGSTGLFTNIPEALEAATADIKARDPRWHTSVILLTDGMVDVSKTPGANAAARDRLLNDILPSLRARGITVHTVALSNQADRALMQRLAVDTGGLFAVAPTAEKLNRVFLQAFDAAAPAEQVPIADNHFTVDKSIQELTALVFHKPSTRVALKDPAGHAVTAAAPGASAHWFKGSDYDLVTIEKPAPGQWTLDAESQPGTRVTIVSNLSLATTRLPESMFINNEAAVTAALKEQDQVLTRADLLKLVTFKADVKRRGDGREWHLDLTGNGSPPSDGYYHVRLPMLTEVGTYDVTVNVDGKTFQRSRQQAVVVRQNFEIKVASTDTLPPRHTVTLFAQNPEITASETRVTAHIKGPDGKVVDQSLTASGDRQWQVNLPPAEHGGRYDVSFDVAGQYRDGTEFKATTEVVAVNDTGSDVVSGEKAQSNPPAAAPAPKAPEHKPAPKQPAAEKAEPAPAAAAPAWKKWALYGGLAVGNLLVLGLGYLAYRMVMGGGKSKVLDESDDAAADSGDADPQPAAKGKEGGKDKPKGKAKPSADLDLPDDAIDIDPDADSRKKK